jgi:hypothetical protein
VTSFLTLTSFSPRVQLLLICMICFCRDAAARLVGFIFEPLSSFFSAHSFKVCSNMLCKACGIFLRGNGCLKLDYSIN